MRENKRIKHKKIEHEGSQIPLVLEERGKSHGRNPYDHAECANTYPTRIESNREGDPLT